jgi:hypothetical protein
MLRNGHDPEGREPVFHDERVHSSQIMLKQIMLKQEIEHSPDLRSVARRHRHRAIGQSLEVIPWQ